MKKLLLLPLLCSSTYAVKMTDYRVIYGQYDEAYINGSFNLESGNQDQVSYDLELDANTRTIFTTAPYAFEFFAQGSSNFSQTEDKNSSTQKAYSIFTATRYDKYLNYKNLFIYSSNDLGYRKQKEAEEADDALVKIGLGVGYGRVYNATPLALTLRIIEELNKYRIINGQLSDVQMLKLAKIIGIKSDYISKYGNVEYKKFWFADMEKVLQNANILPNNVLGTFGVIKMTEVIEIEKISGRFHGWKVRTGAGQTLSSYDGESESTTIDGEFSYGLPIGYQAQYIERAHIGKNLDTSASLDFELTNNMSYTYEITDLIDWENIWNISYDKYYEGEDVIKNEFSTGFRYYIANNLTIDSTLNLQKIDGTNGSSIETPEWDTSVFMGVRYRLK